MSRLLKFLHTVGAAGLTGAIAAMAVVLTLGPATAGADFAVLAALAKIAAWVIGPSLLITVGTGLLAMAATQGFQDAGWVWVKAATGILVLEGGLHAIGPIQEEAKRGAGALAAGDPASTARLLEVEANTLWVLLAVSIANIALGVWRPRFPKYPV